MKNRALLAGVVTLLTVLSALAALPANTAAAAQEEDILYIAMQQDVPDFNNYNLGTNSVWKANVIGFGFESLAQTDYDLKSVPCLAEDWDFDELNLTVTIYLREGVKFHDATPTNQEDNQVMTADDVYFSYLMARDGTTYSSNIIQAFDDDGNGTVEESEIESLIEVVDDYTLKMTMADPFGQFFSSALAVPIMPKYIWEDHVDDENRVDVAWSDVSATWGTGAFYYADGATNSYRVMKKFDGYWGKDFTTPAGYPNYPKVIDTLHYKIYASIDTAILALQGGEVDYIAWAITPGRVPVLQSDPNIALEYMSDSGYFYLAFNMKKEPMNNVSFRRAISHLIDKDQIVDVYMGGFGQVGSAAVPPYFGDWFNPAVTKYPFDIALAEDILDEAGYVDDNDDGLRELPDGRLMDKITLLTPPADYDPIRIRAGQMLATNMRAVGIDVEAKPIDFNTLVAKLTAFDYQMLTLGWRFTGYTECVSVLFDIYGPEQGSNSWAFWSEAHPNPWYSELGGVSTLADETTQALADEFWEVEQDARASFITADQIELTKEGQEIIAKAIPCNVLYYRANVEAHNKIYTNWTVFSGTLINGYCFCSLEYSGGGGTSGGGTVAGISAGLTMSEKVQCDESVDATVLVVNNEGLPVADADIEVSLSNGFASASPLTGTTDATGVFEFTVNGLTIGQTTVTVNATSGDLDATDSASIRVTSLGGIGLVLTPEATVLGLGDSTPVDFLVTDVNGDPVEGATVTVDPYLLGYGSVSDPSAVTDADGVATIDYIAPTDPVLNSHLLVQLAAQATHPKYTLSNLATNGLVVYNDIAPDWYMTTIDSVTTTALSAASPTTTITVLAMDAAGDPLASEELTIWYSNDTYVDTPETLVTTDGSGLASFDVTFADLGTDAALRVTVGKDAVANAVQDTVTLTYADTGALTGMYGGYVQYAAPKFFDALGTLDATIYVFDSQGNPADVNASVVLAATSYGQLTWWSGEEYSSLWDWTGINIVTDADAQNILTAGSFAAPLEDYGLLGVQVVGGEYAMTIEGVALANLDLAMDLFLMPDAVCVYNWDTFNIDIYGQTTISSEYAYGRAASFTTNKYLIDKPVLAAREADFDTTTVTVWAFDENNDPVEGATLKVYQTTAANNDYGAYVDDVPTTKVPSTQASDADGMAAWTVIAASWNAAAATYNGVTRATVPDMYVSAAVAGTITVLSQTQLVIEPIRVSAFVTPTPITEVMTIGDVVYVTVTVTDAAGAPVEGLPVSLTASMGTVTGVAPYTNAEGMATFTIDTSNIVGATAAMIAMQVQTGGTAEGATARIVVAVSNLAPEIEITGPAASAEVEGPNATITGAIYDANGIAVATLSVDGGTPVDLVVTEGAVAIAVSEVLAGLTEGEHTVTILANDTLGVESEAEITFTLVAPEEGDGGGADMLAWGVAAIGWVVAAVVLVMLFMKMKKPSGPKPAEPVEPEVEEAKKE